MKKNTMKKTAKKLSFNKETLRWLDAQEVGQAVGGRTETADCILWTRNNCYDYSGRGC